MSLEARCLNCTVPIYEPVQDDLVYNVLLMDFTIKGGDGFSMIRDGNLDHVQTSKYIIQFCLTNSFLFACLDFIAHQHTYIYIVPNTAFVKPK